MKALKAITLIFCTIAVLLTCVIVVISFTNPEIFKNNGNAVSVVSKVNSQPSTDDNRTNIDTKPQDDPATLIIGKWNGTVVTTDGVGESFEFFRDGTFTLSTLFLNEDPVQYVSFTGHYSFSNNSRLKLQYEESITEIGTLKNTKPWNALKILDFKVDDKSLKFLSNGLGTNNTEWVRD